MIYGYGRVSTINQGKNGNSLQEQENRLREAGAQEIMLDVFTGTKIERPELTKLLARLQSGDKLIITKLDRLARKSIVGVPIIMDLQKRGVTIHILNMGIVDNTPMGKLMVTMLLAFAEFEHDAIVERCEEGKAAARAKGIRVDGRPKKYSPQQMAHALQLLADGNSYTQVEAMTGISKSTLIREKRKAAQKP